MMKDRQIVNVISMMGKRRKGISMAYMKRSGFLCYVGGNGHVGYQQKVKGKGNRFQGTCFNSGKAWHRSRDCWSDFGKGGYKCNGDDYKGKGNGVNAVESHAFAPQPQAIYRQQHFQPTYCQQNRHWWRPGGRDMVVIIEDATLCHWQRLQSRRRTSLRHPRWTSLRIMDPTVITLVGLSLRQFHQGWEEAGQVTEEQEEKE